MRCAARHPIFPATIYKQSKLYDLNYNYYILFRKRMRCVYTSSTLVLCCLLLKQWQHGLLEHLLIKSARRMLVPASSCFMFVFFKKNMTAACSPLDLGSGVELPFVIWVRRPRWICGNSIENTVLHCFSKTKTPARSRQDPGAILIWLRPCLASSSFRFDLLTLHL